MVTVTGRGPYQIYSIVSFFEYDFFFYVYLVEAGGVAGNIGWLVSLLVCSFFWGNGVGGKTCQNAKNIVTLRFFVHDFLCLF